MTTCIACEGFPVEPNNPCGLCGATEQLEGQERYLPASKHSAAECGEAFEWLRDEATRGGASPHAGVALDEWHALAGAIGDEAATEIARLNLELQKRDKCSFIGPMRDCPTHGEGAEIKRLREVLGAINGALEMGISAAEVLDENSPLRDAMRDAL